MLDMMPLQESTILEDQEVPQQLAEEAEENKENASDSRMDSQQTQMLTSATLCDDLEQLLETGYAELIRTGIVDPMAVVLDDSPFPKGMAVFDDDDAEGDDDSPYSNEDEFENGYEVICAREITQIPVFPLS